jgi:hypothetical protein
MVLMPKYTKRGCVLAGALSGLVFTAFEASACHVPFIRAVNNGTAHGTMTVSSGKPCTIRFRSSGPMFHVNIVQAPRHGTVRTAEVASVIYQSRSGFVGDDTFSYARRGLTTRGAPTTRTIKVAVSVR